MLPNAAHAERKVAVLSTTTIKLDDHLCFKLYVASRLVIRGYADELAPIGLTYPKYLVLLALSEEGALTVGRLAERLSLDFGTLSPILKSMSDGGFITRKRQKDDERIVVSQLTPAGRAALRKAMGVAYKLFCETEMDFESFVALRDSMTDYIDRCQRITDRKQAKKQGTRS